MKTHILFILLISALNYAFSQNEILSNEYGYINSMDKILVVKSESDLSNRIAAVSRSGMLKSSDTLINNGNVSNYNIYGVNLSEIKENGTYEVKSNGLATSFSISKNPYSKLYTELHKQLLTKVTSDFSEDNLRQLLSLMYTSFTDTTFSNNKKLIEDLLSHAGNIYSKMDDNTINKERNIKSLLLASTCMSLASFAEQDMDAKRERATLAMKLYIKAVENDKIKENLDLKGTAAFQLYLIFKDPSHLKELIHVLDKMTWPQDFKSEDMRLYFLVHFANVYNITDGFLVKNVDLGIHSEKSLISNAPKVYNQSQLIDYSLSNLYTFQAIKEIKYLKQLMAGLNYMSGLNLEGVSYFDKILKEGTDIEKRKLLILLNNVSLMI